MLVGIQRGRADIEAVHRIAPLPLCVLNPPPDVKNDSRFLAANGVRILMLGNPIFAVAVKAIYDSMKHLKDGGAMEELQGQQASQDLLRAVNRTEEFRQHQQEYMPTKE